MRRQLDAPQRIGEATLRLELHAETRVQRGVQASHGKAAGVRGAAEAIPGDYRPSPDHDWKIMVLVRLMSGVPMGMSRDLKINSCFIE